MKVFVSVLLITLSAWWASAENESTLPIRIMILGLYHMDNPGLDLHNIKTDPVTTDERQKELEVVATRLARFTPNKIAIERLTSNVDLIDEKFAGFTADQLKTSNDERVQIGYRLAQALHSRVFAIDEQSKEINYFPYDRVHKFAEENGRAEFLQGLGSVIESRVKAFEESQRKKSIAELLMDLNLPSEAKQDQRLGYYSLLQLSDSSQYPGAELNAYWYMRNAKIFSKLLRIAKPGDRIIVMFGSGHNFWLRHFVENTEGCELVEANEYLKQ